MQLKLTRLYDNGEITLGKLEVKIELDPIFAKYTYKDYFEYYTLEPPWKDNQRNVSCIPCGIYDLELHNNPQSEFHLKSLHIKNVKDRDGILIHSGNTILNTTGCILVGKSKTKNFYIREKSENYVAVLKSEDALKEILRLCKDKHNLKIEILNKLS